MDSLPLNISRAELLALRNLSKNRNIAILRPDKGNGIIILNKIDYVNKVKLFYWMFLNLGNYILMYWIFALNRKANLFIFLEILYSRSSVFLNLFIVIFPLKEANLVFCMAYQKCTENCPAWPIMSAIGKYNYRLAKFQVPILQPLTVSQYTAHSSFLFVKEITSFKSDDKPVMTSFDVSSLFTNIPLDGTITIITDTLFNETDLMKLSFAFLGITM